jgi:hypothetical protein
MAIPSVGSGDSGQTPGARLLDMLIGWAEWTDAHAGREDAGDSVVAPEELFDLYQEAGALLDGLPEADDEAERRAVIAFLVDRVIPVVARAPAGRARSAA